MTWATCCCASTRPRIACGSNLGRSGTEVFEQDGLDILGTDPTRCGDEGSDLATADESTPSQLDALEPARPSPATDRRRREMDVRRGHDVCRLDEGDPVRGRCHGGQSLLVEDGAGTSAALFRGGSLAPPGVSLRFFEVSPSRAGLSPPAAAPSSLARSEPARSAPPPSELVPSLAPPSGDDVSLAPLLPPAERRSFLAQPDPR